MGVNGSYLFHFLLIFSPVWFGSFWVFEEASKRDFSRTLDYGDEAARVDGEIGKILFVPF